MKFKAADVAREESATERRIIAFRRFDYSNLPVKGTRVTSARRTPRLIAVEEQSYLWFN